jgi:galactonate dehydratase
VGLTWEGGYVITPTAPGLGLELNDEMIAANPYRSNELHLNLALKPVVP